MYNELCTGIDDNKMQARDISTWYQKRVISKIKMNLFLEKEKIIPQKVKLFLAIFDFAISLK